MMSILVGGSTRVIIAHKHFFHIGRVDVVVDHDHVTAVTIGRRAAERRLPRLLGMSGDSVA